MIWSEHLPEHEIELEDGVRTTVIDIAGPAGAPTLLLLHGLGATARLNWGRCFEPLSKHFRVLSLDHRGHGRGLRTRRFRLEQCADDAVAVAAGRGVERFIAVGYSMGGPIASLIWYRHPNRVAGLVLCATARHFVSRRVARMARLVLPAAAQIAPLLPRRARHHVLRNMFGRIEHPELRDYLTREVSGHVPASLIQAAEELSSFSSRDWIGNVNVPTAVIVTTRDGLVPPVRQYELAASIPEAAVYEVTGDHLACTRRADLFVPALVRACHDVEARSREGRPEASPSLAV